MKVTFVAIGNSKGIRIPRAMLEQCGFGATAELAVECDRLVVSPERTVRSGWEQAFRMMGERQDDRLLETPAPAFDEDDWTW